MQQHEAVMSVLGCVAAGLAPALVRYDEPPTCYVTDHPISQQVCAAFAAGCNGRVAQATTLQGGDAVVYGILRGCDEIIRRAQWLNRRFWHIDLGYFRRSRHAINDFSGYYRVSDSGFQTILDETDVTRPPDRWNNLRIELKPWRKTGRNVVIVPPTMAWGRFVGIFPPTWVHTVTEDVKRHTDRPIFVANKTEARFDDLIHDAWAVITLNSNAAIEALIAGVPAFVLGESAAEPLCRISASFIENPLYPDTREQIFRKLAYCQYTLAEFRNGTAWRLMREMHG